MKSFRLWLILVVLSALGGCAADRPATTAADAAPPFTAQSDTPQSPPSALSPGVLSATTRRHADNDNLLLGNPSRAGKGANNYLVERPQYSLSYNRGNGEPNWVAWHLDKGDLGRIKRSDDFHPDPLLPVTWQIRPNDYRGSGYDRGHVCPSGDRTATREDNDATFAMSNMLPQTAALNRAV